MQHNNFFVTNSLFSVHQHGFRANFSCETALQSILDNWKISLDQKKYILALFIDFKKAFDLIDPTLLFLKLFHYGFNNEALDLMKNYFTNRNQSTLVNKSMSSKLNINSGVPQGSILGLPYSLKLATRLSS